MFRPFAILAAFVFLVPGLHSHAKPAAAIDPDYVAALTAANSFLHAWQAHDEEAGIPLLSDRLREHSSEEGISALFSSAPGQQAYEITRGRKIGPGRYQFPITLWQMVSAKARSGAQHLTAKPRATTFIISRAPKEEWLVDQLP